MNATANLLLLIAFGVWFAILGLTDFLVRRALLNVRNATNGYEIPRGFFSFYAKMRWLEKQTDRFPEDLNDQVRRIQFLRRLLMTLTIGVIALFAVAMFTTQ